MFKAVHPVLPVRDINASLTFYVQQLGFTKLFVDRPEQPMYAGIKRGDVEIHLQWHQEENWKQINASSLRFVIDEVAILYEEYKTQGVFHNNTALRKTAWRTQEFAFYDPDMNGLTFYRDL